MLVPAAALWGGVNALFTIALAMNVSRVRGATKTFYGDGANEQLQRAIRTHANNTEYTPLAIVLLLILQLSGVPPLLMHIFGGAYSAARLSHAVGFGNGITPLRVVGAMLTWIAVAGMAICSIYFGCGSG